MRRDTALSPVADRVNRADRDRVRRCAIIASAGNVSTSMKNQYFGDIRDLFKYDLIQNIVGQSRILERCIWIPMLTANDASLHGEKRSRPKAGWHNQELKAFLDSYDKGRSERNISHLQGVRFFRKPRVVVFSLHRDNGDFLPDFTHSSRRTYFAEVEGALRPNSLLFLDPDTGIETPSRRRERHVLLREIADLHSAMDASSVLMIYQHHHMVQRPEFLRRGAEHRPRTESAATIRLRQRDLLLLPLEGSGCAPGAQRAPAVVCRGVSAYLGWYGTRCKSVARTPAWLRMRRTLWTVSGANSVNKSLLVWGGQPLQLAEVAGRVEDGVQALVAEPHQGDSHLT